MKTKASNEFVVGMVISSIRPLFLLCFYKLVYYYDDLRSSLFWFYYFLHN